MQLSEAQRFAAVLQEGPEACLRGRSDGRPAISSLAWSEPLYPDRCATSPTRRSVSSCAEAPTPRSCGNDSRRSSTVRWSRMVGTRAPSPYGEEMAGRWAATLRAPGVLVVSGLAMGIDAIAQAAAVRADSPLRPRTVAVLGCGPDVVYPRQNARLYREVGERGLICQRVRLGRARTCLAVPGAQPGDGRSRAAVVLVEGAARSGARITAGFAVDLGRDVLACPARRDAG